MLQYTFWSFFVCGKFQRKSYQRTGLAEASKGNRHTRFQQSVLKTLTPFREYILYNLPTILNLC
jgi:hypothetical protein